MVKCYENNLTLNTLLCNAHVRRGAAAFRKVKHQSFLFGLLFSPKLGYPRTEPRGLPGFPPVKQMTQSSPNKPLHRRYDHSQTFPCRFRKHPIKSYVSLRSISYRRACINIVNLSLGADTGNALPDVPNTLRMERQCKHSEGPE